MQWTFDYLSRGVAVAGNSPRVNRELRVMAAAALGLKGDQLEKMIPLLSNYYPVSSKAIHQPQMIDGVIDVGCFGAFRPLKNHLIQAIAAIDFSERRGLKLRFHVNSGRVEMAGGNQLKNLRALFDNVNHELVEHPWAAHEDFLKLLNQMDICLQVSFTETFNIVSADSVNLGVPTLVSDEINWVHAPYADPTSSTDIVEKMAQVLTQRHYLIEKNRENLAAYSRQSNSRWLSYLNEDLTGHGLNLDVLFSRFFGN